MKLSKPFVALALSAQLAGCGAIQPHLVLGRGIPTAWTYDSVKREAFYDRRDLIAYCVDHHGWFTHDNGACMIQQRKLCVYVTPPYDNRHNAELTALCNGWRPMPRFT